VADPNQTPEYYVVCYANSPGFKGMDAYLGPGGAIVYSHATANRYLNLADAADALRGVPVIGRGYEQGTVRPVYTVTREVVGEAVADLPGRVDGPHAGPVPKLGQILKGFLGGGGFRGFA
jgi:hypothetical protein